MDPVERNQLCQLFVEAFANESEADPLASLAAALPARESPKLAVGQLWRLVRVDRPGQSLVALTHLGEVTRGVVASADTFLAANDDMLVSASDSPTGEALALHVWLDVPVRADALRGFVGVLPTHVVEPLLMLLQRQLTGGFVLRARESMGGAGPEATRWDIAPRGALDRTRAFVTGSRIVDATDGRIAARTALRSAVAWIAEDALAAVTAEASETPWHRAFAERLRNAVRAIGASLDVPESDFNGGRAPAFGHVGMTAGAFSLSGLPGMFGILTGAAATLGENFGAASGDTTPQFALRQSLSEQGQESVVFALPISDARVSGKVYVREGEIDLLVVARVGDRPLRGLKVTVRVDREPVALQRTTDRGGTASMAGIAVKPGTKIEMEFSHGRVKRLVTVA